MKYLLITFLFLSSARLYSQTLIDFIEMEKVREQSIKSMHASVDTENTNLPLPLISLGGNINRATDAVGFRPTLIAGTSAVKGIFGMNANLQFSQVDDQQFSVEGTGQTLFVQEVSNFSANLIASVAIPNIKNWKASPEDFYPRIGFTGGFHFRGNSLFNLDSTSFTSVKNDISSVGFEVGAECILIKDLISVYVKCNYLGITNNRNSYHAYFPENAIKDFWYIQPGFRFKAIEGADMFKNIVIDFSSIFLTQDMRVVTGQDNTILPVLKVGYTTNIGWKKSFDKRMLKAME